MPSNARYEDDVVACSVQQVRLLLEGGFDLLDILHLAEEIEDVGKRAQRQLANRMAVLPARLLKWQRQADRRGASWQMTNHNHRLGISRRLDETPSLRRKLAEPDWWVAIWDDATAQVAEEAGLYRLPRDLSLGAGPGPKSDLTDWIAW